MNTNNSPATANLEDQMRFVVGQFVSESEQKCGNYHRLCSLLAEGIQGTSPPSCTDQSHCSIPLPDDQL